MKKCIILSLIASLAVFGCATKKPEPAPATAATEAEIVATTDVSPTPDEEIADTGLDVSSLKSASARSIAPFSHGTTRHVINDFLPILSDSSNYSQKWEFYIYTEPYETRIKFEISSMAFSKNEGKIRGYVQKNAGDQSKEYRLSETLKKGQWHADTNSLSLEFGDYRLKYSNGMFYISGSFEEGTFEYEIPAHFWKPGTGTVYFGNNPENEFKYSVLTYHEPVSKGVFHVNGEDIPVSGQAYANHYAMTQAVYEVYDEFADFRHRTDDLLIEFRYYVPNSNYDAVPFGFMFVAAEGVPLLSSTDLNRTTVQKWLDEDNYGYEIDANQILESHEGANSARISMKNVNPKPEDPYADLSILERKIATRFAQPIEYSIGADWEVNLDIDGYKAKIPFSRNYSLTRLH